MSRIQHLNQAVIAQVLDDLRHGQLFKSRRMGFAEEDLDAVLDTNKSFFLANSPVSWCSVTVNLAVLRSLLKKLEQDQKDAEETDRLIRLAVSTKLVSQNFGLNSQEVALMRGIVGVPAIKGRPHSLPEAAEDDLWNRFIALLEESGSSMDDERALLTIVATLAESTGHPYTSIWRLIGEWKSEGLTPD